MDLHQALLGRRTVHAYRRDPVPDAAIERALTAAIHAPNHRLTFPWRFIRVGRDTRRRIAEIAVELKGGAAVPAEAAAKVRAKVLDPHELLVVSIVSNADPEIGREDYASAACAIQNLMLSLHGDGIASKWSTGKPSRHPETYAALGIDAGSEEIIAFVWIGHAEITPEVRPRPALAELVRRLP